MSKNGIRGVSIGMTGSGALMIAISLMVDNSYWLLVTGTVFLVIGLIVYFARGR